MRSTVAPLLLAALLGGGCVERALPLVTDGDGGSSAVQDLSTTTPDDGPICLGCPSPPQDMTAPPPVIDLSVPTMGTQGCFDVVNCYFMSGPNQQPCQDQSCFAMCDAQARSMAVVQAARDAEGCIIKVYEGPCGPPCMDPSDMGQAQCVQCIYGDCSPQTGQCMNGPCSQPYDACLKLSM